MSIIRPQKLLLLSGPGSEYFTSKIVKGLTSLYAERYKKLTESIMWKYNITEEDVLRRVSFIDDIYSKAIPDPECMPGFNMPELLLDVKYTKFKNGEVKAELKQAVRGRHVYVVYDVSNDRPIKLNLNSDETERVVFSVNDHLMMIFTIVNALTLSGAESITLILPTYPYARQHKKDGREALTAALVTRFFENLHVKRIITLDIHSREIENACDTLHIENLHAAYQIITELQKVFDLSKKTYTVVAPDSGAVGRNKFYATTLGCPLAMLYKERDYSIVSKDAASSNIKSIKLLGDVKGQDVIIADDMIATGGTLLNVMKELKKFGAKKIICLVSLPFFNGNAPADFDKAYKEGIFYRIIGTNAVYHEKELLGKEWFVQADVAELFAEIVLRLHHGLSITDLLDNRHFVQKLLEESKNK